MKVLLSFILIFALLAPVATMAQAPQGLQGGIQQVEDDIAGEGSGLFKGDEGQVNTILVRIINFLLSIIAVVALAVLIWGALMYILSLGNESRAEKAKKIMLYAIVGLILAGLSFAIIKIVQTFLTGDQGG